MDTSETYIKMRLAARGELLDGAPPLLETERDPFWVAPTVFVDDKGDFYYADKTDHCQLERQDQLQEMVDKGYLTGLIYDLYEFSSEYLYMDDGEHLRFKSMEQLWLAFVMKEKHNKIWDGKEWTIV